MRNFFDRARERARGSLPRGEPGSGHARARDIFGRISEWSVTNPTQTIVAVASLVVIIGVLGALRLAPDAGTEKLVDNGSEAFVQTEEFRDRFGDDAIVVLAREDLQKLVLTEDLGNLLALESCLSGAPVAEVKQGRTYPAELCNRLAGLDAVEVVFGPATFLNTSSQQAKEFFAKTLQETQANAATAAEAARKQAAKNGATKEEQEQVASQASEAVFNQTFEQFSSVAAEAQSFGLDPSIDNPLFVSSIVFDSRQPAGTPKSRFGYLFPSPESALVSIRLDADIPNETRREAIDLIREVVSQPAFELSEGDYAVTGVPVVVEGLADGLRGEIFILLAVAMMVMALTLLLVFGPPMPLLPLFVAAAASAVSFGLLSLIGGSLTMASVAVLPVVIGLGVDYAIQLQSRFREAIESGERPAAAAVMAAMRGGPTIGIAAIATSVGFLALLLSPIPMIREFALALVIGIAAALGIALTAGLAILSLRQPTGAEGPSAGGMARARRSLGSNPRIASGATWARRISAALRERTARFSHLALATAIGAPAKVLAVAAVVAVVGWGAGSQTEVVSDIRELVPGDLPALESIDKLESATGVSGELDVLVRGEDVTSPEAIAWMAEFKQRILDQNGFDGEFPDCRDEGTGICPGPALPDLFSVASPDQERIDGVLEAVPDYFSQAILSTPPDRDEVAAIAFLIPVMPLDEQEELISSIRSELDPPPGIEAEVVGLTALVADANADLSGSRYWLALTGLLAVALVLLGIYRSPSRALVPLIPIALATGWSALVLAAMDVPLNPMSATLGALVIAVATEFSVILSSRYYEEREAGATMARALRSTYSRTGGAVVASGITSIAGFGVLIASDITMLRDFGLVTIVDLGVALVGVLVVLPAALVWGEGGMQATLARIRRRLARRPTSAEPAL
ncbi:MAG: efflux RND transporter permease subunit [Solirubrobacterales bacterium]